MAFVMACGACAPGGQKSKDTGTTEGQPDGQPSQEQQDPNGKKDPTLADQYVDAVGAAMVKDGAKQADVDATTASVKADVAKDQAAALNLEGQNYNDPAVVFSVVPQAFFADAIKNGLKASLPSAVAGTADFISKSDAIDKDEGKLFASFAESSMKGADDDTLIADLASEFMGNLKKVVAKDDLASAAPDFLGGLFASIKTVNPNYDFAGHIETLVGASSAVGDAGIATDVFGRSMDFIDKFVKPDELNASLDKINEKATAYIAKLDKADVAENMAKLSAAVFANVGADQAAAMQAKIQAAVAGVDPTLNSAFQTALDKKLADAKVPQTTIDAVKADANDQLVCPTGTTKSATGCVKTVTTTPTDPVKYWVSDSVYGHPHAEYTEAELSTLFKAPADKISQFKSLPAACAEGSAKTFMVYFDTDGLTVLYGMDCMTTQNFAD